MPRANGSGDAQFCACLIGGVCKVGLCIWLHVGLAPLALLPASVMFRIASAVTRLRLIARILLSHPVTRGGTSLRSVELGGRDPCPLRPYIYCIEHKRCMSKFSTFENNEFLTANACEK